MPAPSAERLRALFAEAVAGVDPRALVRERVAELSLPGPVTVMAVGKAAAAMAHGVVDALEGRVDGGVVVAPGPVDVPAPLEALAASHPRPDLSSVRAANALLERAAQCRTPHLLALISGGASSLACAPAPGLTLDDKLAAVDAVMAGGAPIGALNAVRKHLSAIKGGRLAAAATAPVTTLVISDVVGDDLATIGSGPTVPDPTTFADALAAVDRYAGRDAIPTAVRAHLEAGADETAARARPQDRIVLVAGLSALVDRAAAAHGGVVMDRALSGDVGEVAERVVGWIDGATPGQLRLAAGEPTVVVPPGAGAGGRATQLALLVARRIRGRAGVAVLVAGTDGVDGSSGAAGAVVDGGTWDRVEGGDDALARCDAATALGPTGALVVTGPTGVNHADMIAVLRDPGA